MAYKMDHKYRGVAVIFNHYEFWGPYSKREGTEKDVEKLSNTFKKLGFEVKEQGHKDLTVDEIQSKLQEVVQWYEDPEHGDSDCLVVAVLTHGKAEDKLVAKDREYHVSMLFTPLINCTSLQGKPKLFFLQACKSGKKTVGDSGDVVQYEASESGDSDRGEGSGASGSGGGADAADSSRESSSFLGCCVPTEPDILISYATFEGQYAFRRLDEGSPYVKALCAELDTVSPDEDLLPLLTRVNRTVGQSFVSNNPEKPELHEKVQQPCYTSSLTRRLYFPKRRSSPN